MFNVHLYLVVWYNYKMPSVQINLPSRSHKDYLYSNFKCFGSHTGKFLEKK